MLDRWKASTPFGPTAESSTIRSMRFGSEVGPVGHAVDGNPLGAKSVTNGVYVLRHVDRRVEVATWAKRRSTSSDVGRLRRHALKRWTIEQSGTPSSAHVNHHDVARASLCSHELVDYLAVVGRRRRLTGTACDQEERQAGRSLCLLA